MKKIFILLFLISIAVFVWYGFRPVSDWLGFGLIKPKVESAKVQKHEILNVGLLADSEDDNNNLQKAVDGIRLRNVNFAVFLGDLTQLGETKKLEAVKAIMDKSGLKYYVTAGDHDLWAARNDKQEALSYVSQFFGKTTQVVKSNKVIFTILDNSDIYKGISDDDWFLLKNSIRDDAKLHLVFAHKTPFHPQSAHIMGEDTPSIADQARQLLAQLEADRVDGLIVGDLHFFAQFNSPKGMKIVTIGAVEADRNFQGPRYAILRVYDDYSWDVEDVPINQSIWGNSCGIIVPKP